MKPPLRRLRPALVFSLLLLSVLFAQAQPVTNSNASLTTMVQNLMGPGCTVSNITRNCPTGASGSFSGFGNTDLNLSSGTVLSTGTIDVFGMASVFMSTNHQAAGNSLVTLVSGSTQIHDACVIEFDVTFPCSLFTMEYVFGSEEYPEYANTAYNDAFGLFITGPNPNGGNYSNVNIAKIPNTNLNVTINNLNNGNNNTGPCEYCQYYIDNTGGGNIKLDGFTTPLVAEAEVVPCATYHIAIAIGDVYDYIYDSHVFLKNAGINCPIPNVTVSPTAIICNGASTTLTAGNASTYTWSPATGLNTTTGQSVIASPTVTTTYTVTGISGCGNVSTTAQVVVVVLPAPTVTGTTVNESCPGANDGSATAIASGNGPFTYSWNTGATTATITGLAGGSYTCVVTGNNGCSTTVTVSVNTTPAPPPISLSASAQNLCGGTLITYTISPFNSALYNYTVAVTPSAGVIISPVSATGTFTANYLNAACQDYTVTVTAANPANPAACNSSASMMTYKCCPCTSNFPDVVVGTPASGIYTASQLINYLSTNSHPAFSTPNIYNNAGGGTGILYINGTFIVDVPLVLNTSRIMMGGMAKIDIPAGTGSVLDINKCVITAGCNNMWDGIYLHSPTELVNIVNKSVVEDALNVVNTANGGNYFIDRTTFNRNYKGVVVTNYSNHPGMMQRSQITCAPTLLNSFNMFLLAPHQGERTHMGFEITAVNGIQVGNPANGGMTNKFDNMNYGVRAIQSDVKVYNNRFLNITHQTVPMKNTTGRAVWSTGLGVHTLEVGAAVTPSYANEFDNCDYGVFAEVRLDVYVKNNVFKNHTSTGIFITKLDELNDAHVTDNNRLTNMPNGVWCYDNPQAFILIDNNNINLASLSPTRGNAIMVHEFYGFNTANHSVTITNNTIKAVRHGIWTLNVDDNTLIQNNALVMTSTPYNINPVYYTEGILAENTSRAVITDNRVESSLGIPSWWMSGIRVSGFTNTVTCNYTHDIGRGLFFDGTLTPFTGVARNIMEDNETGLVLNYGVIGPQGFGNIPYDNTWIGSFTCYTDAYASNGLLSPFRTRQGGLPYNPFLSANCNNNGGTLIPGTTCTNSNCSLGLNCPLLTVPFNNDYHDYHLAVIGGSNQHPQYDAEADWTAQFHLYKYFTQNPPAAGTAEYAFMLSPQAQTFGLLDSLGALAMGVVECDPIQVIRNGPPLCTGVISSYNPLELNLHTVLRLIHGLAGAQPSDDRLAYLEDMASRCPFADGPAVYVARGYLSGLTGLSTVYHNSCEDARPPGAQKSGEQLPAVASIVLFPNPAGDQVMIRTHAGFQPQRAEWFSLEGKLVSAQLPEEEAAGLFRTATPEQNGLYLLRITDDAGHSESRLIEVFRP